MRRPLRITATVLVTGLCTAYLIWKIDFGETLRIIRNADLLMVAGAAAIIFQAHPDYSPDNVKWALIAKQGAKPKDSKTGSLSLSSSYNLAGTPGRANQGVPALVCAPGTTCLSGSTVASSWDSSSWNSSSWKCATC